MCLVEVFLTMISFLSLNIEGYFHNNACFADTSRYASYFLTGKDEVEEEKS